MITVSEPFDAVILAGGASSRLGHPKALLDWNGIPLWKHIVREVAAVACKITIVGFPEQFAASDLALARFIDDPVKIGPLGALAIGLRSAETDKVFVMACDMPFVRREAILDLINNSKGSDIVVPRTPDGIHPLFAIYSRDCLAAIETALANNERRTRAFYDGCSVRELIISDDNTTWKNVLVNINTPDELAEAMGNRNYAPITDLLFNPFGS
ncbi:MAG: molybdenum cofactor guanylyltransferase [Candidatus Riflebacteria bacterium]|nr:molybdenum cofactor guanylyltransferase [Candidatus Riflebacteria bacterium]